MKWEEIEKIIKTEGGKFIIVEDGEPRLVIMGFEDYKKRNSLQISEDGSQGKDEDEDEDIETNQENFRKSDSKDELTIDDLPL